MKKIITIALTVALLLCALTACKADDSLKIGVPNDTTNEARALLLLEDLGYITLKEGAGITATVRDIADNPYGIVFEEIEAAQLPNVLPDLDYAIINSNYAISAGMNPVEDSLGIEGAASAYGNILSVKEGKENEPKILALVAALESRLVWVRQEDGFANNASLGAVCLNRELWREEYV